MSVMRERKQTDCCILLSGFSCIGFALFPRLHYSLSWVVNKDCVKNYNVIFIVIIQNTWCENPSHWALVFSIIYKADVTVSKVLCVSTVWRPFQLCGCLCWLRKFNLSAVVFRIPSIGLFSDRACFSVFLRKLPETDIFFIVSCEFFPINHHF